MPRTKLLREWLDQHLSRRHPGSTYTLEPASADASFRRYFRATLPDGGTRIVFRQKKTKGLEYLDITGQAVRYMGQRGKADERVFAGLKYSAWHNLALREWCLKAGITKHITFHCGRHTFAVLQLSLGTEIYTVSKLLGHRELKTTQVYAQIMDEKKREAVNRIPEL